MAVIEVVKYNGGPNVFAWKYPSEELGTWTQLIVNESQEAVMYKEGKVLDIFTAGRHTLDTANIPILNKLINLPFGGRSPFTAEVWYVNKVNSLDIKWGTATPIQLQDPKYKVFIPLRAFGQFGIQIVDSKKFLVSLVGTLSGFDKNDIIKYFRGVYLTKIKDVISGYLIKKEISTLEINAYLDEISQQLKEKITSELDLYGIRLVNFYVNDISTPEDDPAVKQLKDALAKKAEMDIVGYTYTQERSFDTLEGAASNPSSGHAAFMGPGLGLGMGLGLGGAFGTQFSGIARHMSIHETTKCPSCGHDMDMAQRFCASCGSSVDAAKKTVSVRVTCSNCGAKFSKGTKFCPECGDRYNPCMHCGADLKDGDAVCPKCGRAAPKPCPNCGEVIDASSAKFCPECGGSLMESCGKCGNRIEGTPKFCPECGNKL